MPYVKAVPLSRIAGQALKSFTHGYAQTVVAASQSSYAAQNAPGAGPLTDTLVGRLRKAERSRISNAVPNGADTTRQASTTAPSAAVRPETSHHDSGLEKYLDAWQKHQRAETKEWQPFQLARRIEWQPPSTLPVKAQESSAVEEPTAQPQQSEEFRAPSLKRSYTTSALDNFSQAFIHDAAAQADALEQVNNAIAEEIQRSKDEAEDGIVLKTSGASTAPQEQTIRAGETNGILSASFLTPAESLLTPEIDTYTSELLSLAGTRQHDRVSAAFRAMLQAGVQQPSPAAYRVLLTSVIDSTRSKHQRVPKALEVYSDMLRRKVTPDVETFGVLIQLLAKRSGEVLALQTDLAERRVRYGGLEAPGKFMFRSAESEHSMLLEDASLSIALKLFDRAVRLGLTSIPSQSCAALVVACAERGQLSDMIRVYQHIQSRGLVPDSGLFPSMIVAFGRDGDLKSAVDVYDEYKELAVANNAGKNQIVRVDDQVYAALIKAYGLSDRLEGGLKFLASIQGAMASEQELLDMRETVALEALLPLALKDDTFQNASDLVQSLSGRALTSSLSQIAIAAADKNLVDVSQNAFDSLGKISQDLASPAMAMLAMHVRNANVEAAEPYWRILEGSPADLSFVEPSTMHTVALIGVGQTDAALRQLRRMFTRIRERLSESMTSEAMEQFDEALELVGNFMLKHPDTLQASTIAELLRMMIENGGLITPLAEHLLARMGADQIATLSQTDLELFLRVQSDMIMHGAAADIAGPARFGVLLDTIISRHIVPSTNTESTIEKALVNLDNPMLSRTWNAYRYPQTPGAVTSTAFTPVLPYQGTPMPFAPVRPSFDETYDPYAARTDIKGSNLINDLLERPQGRRLNEALTKFRNMRRVGRAPRMFTYGKLIEAAAKDSNLSLAHEVLEMAKQDVPYDARYRVVRFGWQQILDHMVAACLNLGRRDLAAQYHQDLLSMGVAPSANTFGLYITTLKENTKTFDEASEAVKIFLRAKAEGVEPSSFLYNALIGKLGKARRIDDCLFYFAEMRNLGIRPTSVTYGTIVNALCRVSDEKFAEEIFEEMEACSNYKPRPAPYHSLMQFFLTTKRDKSKVLSYYERMRAIGIQPTVHTYKLLIDTHATLEPIDLQKAQQVLSEMQVSSVQPEAVHYAALIHAQGCALHDMEGARSLFQSVITEGVVKPQPCIYQAMFESLNANHAVSTAEFETLLADMRKRGVEYTPYIANALIHGWTLVKDVTKAREAFNRVPISKREPSTYDAMVRAHLAAEDRESAKAVIGEALGRGYPSAVSGKIAELVR